MEEVRFIRCTRAQYDKLMGKDENAFYVTDENTQEDNVQEKEIQQQD